MRQEQNRVESLTEHQRGEGASCPEAWAWVPWPEVVTCSLSRVIKGTHTSHSGISDCHRCTGNLCLLLLESCSNQGTFTVSSATFLSVFHHFFPGFLRMNVTKGKL